MAVRDPVTSLYEARRIFRSTGQEFVGVGVSKELATAELKKQLDALNVDYKKDIDALALATKELIKNQANAKRAELAKNLAEKEESVKNLDNLEKEARLFYFKCKNTKKLDRINAEEVKALKRVDFNTAKELREVTKMVSIGKLPKRTVPIEPTGNTFRSSGFAVSRDDEGRVGYGFSAEQRRNMFARPDLAAEISKDLKKTAEAAKTEEVTK